MKKIELKFEGIDDWNFAVFKAQNSERFGDLFTLFSNKATYDEVVEKVRPENLVYFGKKFNCVPCGTPIKADALARMKFVKNFKKNNLLTSPDRLGHKKREIMKTKLNNIKGYSLVSTGDGIWDWDIIEMNYYGFLAQYAEHTTTPNGVAPLYHIRDNNGKIEGWTWGYPGRFPKKLTEFSTNEEAEEWLYGMMEARVEKEGDEKYWSENLADLKEQYIEVVQHSILGDECWKPAVILSIWKHYKIWKRGIDDRRKREMEKKAKTNRELAERYAKLINHIPGESSKETAIRLSKAIGKLVSGSVLHMAVKIVRQEV